MPAYLMETHDADELVLQDPFGGIGVFLPSALPDGDEILGKVGEVFGTIPAVAFPQKGAWADPSRLNLGRDEVIARWAP